MKIVKRTNGEKLLLQTEQVERYKYPKFWQNVYYSRIWFHIHKLFSRVLKILNTIYKQNCLQDTKQIFNVLSLNLYNYQVTKMLSHHEPYAT